MKRMKKVKEEEVIRASLDEINLQSAPVGHRCSSGWPQNCTVRVFTALEDAFDYGLYLKKEGMLLPRECNVNPFEEPYLSF
jgi:hypothetical protein